MLSGALASWGQANVYLMERAASKDFVAPLLVATEYLSLMGDLVTGYFLLRKAVKAWHELATIAGDAGVALEDAKALRKLARENPDARFYYEKVKTAQFFAAHELPLVQAKTAAVTSGDTSSMELFWEDLG